MRWSACLVVFTLAEAIGIRGCRVVRGTPTKNNEEFTESCQAIEDSGSESCQAIEDCGSNTCECTTEDCQQECDLFWDEDSHMWWEHTYTLECPESTSPTEPEPTKTCPTCPPCPTYPTESSSAMPDTTTATEKTDKSSQFTSEPDSSTTCSVCSACKVSMRHCRRCLPPDVEREYVIKYKGRKVKFVVKRKGGACSAHVK